MTLEDKLKEIDDNAWKFPPGPSYVLQLVAALRKCREQRDSLLADLDWYVGSNDNPPKEAAGEYDAELLSILSGSPEEGKDE